MKKLFLILLFSTQVLVNAQSPTLEWLKQYGTPNKFDVPVNLDTDLAGNVYIGATLDKDRAGSKMRVAKYNSSGTLIWSKIYTPDFDYESITMISMDVDSVGNICVLGWVNADVDAYYKMVLLKYNASGTTLWTDIEQPTGLDILPRAMAVDKTGHIYICGSFIYDKGTNHSKSDYFVFKYNKLGSKSWGAFYNGSAGRNDDAFDINFDGAGNCYVTGASEEKDPRSLATLKKNTTIKYSSSGYFQWSRKQWYPNAEYTHFEQVKLDGSGNIYVITNYLIPNYEYVCSLTKFNASGTEFWSKSFAGLAMYGVRSTVDASGNCYLTSVVPGAGIRNLNISTRKYNAAGSQLWTAQYDGGDSTFDFPSDIDVDHAGNVYITGSSSVTKFVQPWLERRPKAITIKYSDAGSQVWVANYSGPKTDPWAKGTCLALHGGGSQPLVYVAGNTVNGVIDDVATSDDILLLKYNQSKAKGSNSTLEPIGLLRPVSDYKLSAAPNPFRSSTVIRFDIPYDAQVSLKIYDVSGRELSTLVSGSRRAGSYQSVFDAGRLSSQQYFYTLKLTTAKGEFKETKPLLLSR